MLKNASPVARPVKIHGDGSISADVCIIGAGSGGLSVAAGAAQLGASVVLIEKGRMGGDCLNYGCVPSKAMIAAAHHAQSMREAAAFGIDGSPQVDFARVMAHVEQTIATIAPHDSVERFEGLGVHVLNEKARFLGPTQVQAGSLIVNARRFVVATGSHAVAPPVPGLEGVDYLTNETVFSLKVQPQHLIVLGGGPIGVELAQAFRRLGSQVTLVERFSLMARAEPEAREIIRARLQAEGIAIHENAIVKAAWSTPEGVALEVAQGNASTTVSGSHLLVAAGRAPNLDGLDCEAAGIATTPKGITVGPDLRSTNRRVYAVGDVAGGPQFTHVAGYHAGIVIRQILFGLSSRTDLRALPAVTFCDPEVAQVGLSEAEAREKDHGVIVLTARLDGNDRAVAERRCEGMVKLVFSRRKLLLGATIVAPAAGEMIGLLTLGVHQGVSVSTLAQMIAPYPTLAEAIKRAAGSYYTPRLFAPGPRRIVRLVQFLIR